MFKSKIKPKYSIRHLVPSNLALSRFGIGKRIQTLKAPREEKVFKNQAQVRNYFVISH